MRFGPFVTATGTFCSSIVLATAEGTINVLYRYDRSDDKHAIAAFNDAKQLIGYTCDYTLDHGSFATQHVYFKVDEQAQGEINVGGKAYPIHSRSELSGGPACNRIYNHKMVELDCTVTMEGGFVGSPIASNKIKSCFGRDLETFDLSKGIRRIDTSKAGTVDRRSPVPLKGPDGFQKVHKRCLISRGTEASVWVIQQQYLEKQITQKISCESAWSCSASVTDRTSFTWNFQATANPSQWISAGFSVGKSYTEAASYTCGGQKGETVCVWYSAAYTQYAGQNMIYSYCDSGLMGKSTEGHPFEFKSPNSEGKGSDFYCVIGTCQYQGAGYWNTDGRYGGPDGVDDLGDGGLRGSD